MAANLLWLLLRVTFEFRSKFVWARNSKNWGDLCEKGEFGGNFENFCWLK